MHTPQSPQPPRPSLFPAIDPTHFDGRAFTSADVKLSAYPLTFWQTSLNMHDVPNKHKLDRIIFDQNRDFHDALKKEQKNISYKQDCVKPISLFHEQNYNCKKTGSKHTRCKHTKSADRLPHQMSLLGSFEETTDRCPGRTYGPSETTIGGKVMASPFENRPGNTKHGFRSAEATARRNVGRIDKRRIARQEHREHNFISVKTRQRREKKTERARTIRRVC